MDMNQMLEQNYALQDRYIEILTDFIQSPPTTFKALMELSMAKITDEQLLLNFVLYIFYLSDRLTTSHLLKGFKESEQEYYTKVLYIEQYLPECCEKINKTQVYNKALDFYSKVVTNA
jgi:hypothetical protein